MPSEGLDDGEDDEPDDTQLDEDEGEYEDGDGQYWGNFDWDEAAEEEEHRAPAQKC